MTLTDSVNADASVSVDGQFLPAGNIARGFAFFLPYMTVFFSKNRLTLIDMLCKTKVVQKGTV
jgi:uncharacterized RDD family membrane protein YckC